MDVFGLPLGSALALLIMVLLPVVTYALYRCDARDSSRATPPNNA